MYNESVSIKKSVAASLIKKVFGIYFVLTIMVTLTQLSIEYFHVKESIINDIMKMEKSFEPGISGTLWDYDWRNLRLILFGINELSAVVGVRIDNAQETEVGAAGVILRGERQVHVAPDGESFASSSDTSFTPMRGLFSHSFDIDYENTVSGKSYVVGKATIYSSSGVVIDRIKYGFFLIIVNSVIKTAGLWVIIFFFARRIIGRPLAVLAESAERMNPNNPDFSEIRRSSEERRLLQSENELGILARSFDRMRDAILERMDNLHRVRDVGEDLAVIRDIPATFARVVGTMGEKFAFGKGTLFLPDSQNVLRPEGEDADTDASCLPKSIIIITYFRRQTL
ncbi:HAMP domain-containing protein [Desulfobacterales bacterium HSG2]|nr:HAMP domain-containing protein [Desulfobacterales bacterium HSG2]